MAHRPSRCRAGGASLALALVLAFAAGVAAPPLPAREIAEVVAFGHFGRGIGEFKFPVGLTLDAKGNIVVADFENAAVSIYDKAGVFQGPVNAEGIAFGGPVCTCFDPAGNLYVVEFQRHQIRKFDPGLKQVAILGGPGREPGRFREPHGVVADGRGHLFVADSGNRRIQELDPEGRFVRAVVWLDPELKRNAQPRGVGFDPQGALWASYSSSDRLVRFDAALTGTEVVLGGRGEHLGQLNQPRYFAFDVQGNVYVSDRKNHRVQKFARDGRFLYAFGVEGRAKGQLSYPEGLAVDEDGNVVVADAKNYRIQILTVRKRTSYDNRAYTLFARQEWEKAAEWYQKVLEVDPGNLEASNRLERCWRAVADRLYEAGKQVQARRFYDEIDRVHPSDPDVQRRIRAIFWDQNKDRVYYVVLGLGIMVTMLLLLITMIRILRSE